MNCHGCVGCVGASGCAGRSGRSAAAAGASRPADRMRSAGLLCARGALVAGPFVLAFRAGGFFDGPRDVALLVAAAPCSRCWRPRGAALLPRHPAARVALAAALGYAAWIALSATWAPVRDLAGDDAERALLYAAVLTAAAAAFRERRCGARAGAAGRGGHASSSSATAWRAACCPGWSPSTRRSAPPGAWTSR